MAIVNKPNTFSGNTTISSSEVNSNFDTLYNEFNGSISAANLADDAVTAAKLADNAVVTANMTDLSVTNAKLAMQAWQSYTPTFSNTTKGDGTVTGAYTQIGKTVHFRAQFTLGSTSAVTGSIVVSFPVTAISIAANTPIGTVNTLDTNTTLQLPGHLFFSTTTTGVVSWINSSVQYAQYAYASSTVPFTWATGDIIYIQGTYEAA